MIVKVEMYLEIQDSSLEDIKKIEHHADSFLSLDEYPEIESVFGVRVSEEKSN